MSEMAPTDDRTAFQRLQRLKAMLRNRLENPAAALEALLAALLEGEPHAKLWEDLHAAAAREGAEQALAAAYNKLASSPRMRKLAPEVQTDIFMHAADFFQGILGDAATAEDFLERVHHLAPGHAEAFSRLERRFEALQDPHKLLELYAIAGSTDATSKVLASKVAAKIALLRPSAPLPDAVCEGLVVFAGTNLHVLETLEEHCRATKRMVVAGRVIERALLDPRLDEQVSLRYRRRLVELYIGEAKEPALAIDHVEALLNDDPSDEATRRAAERLLATPKVAKRAAAILQNARRWGRGAEQRKRKD
jgi:hypothetical protein